MQGNRQPCVLPLPSLWGTLPQDVPLRFTRRKEDLGVCFSEILVQPGLGVLANSEPARAIRKGVIRFLYRSNRELIATHGKRKDIVEIIEVSCP